MDHLDGAIGHLRARDVTFALVSRAPLAAIAAFKQRMGWHFSWVSSHGTNFNSDFGVSYTKEQIAAGKPSYNFGTIPPFGEECPGLSVFAKDAGTYAILDMVPKGRDEGGLPSTMSWIKHHDKYEQLVSLGESCCQAKEART
jgi:predicted dithiol-disulfide oxidoreductase (DUF899 family)